MDFKNENKPLQEDLQARIDERKRKLGKKIFIRRFILILAAFIIIFFISKYAGAFNVKNVKISGNQKTKIEDVVKKGNIKTGASYFTFAGKAARKNIEDLPYVKTAKISLIPFGPVKITIKERVPVSQVEDQGNYYLLDDEYRVLEKMESPKEELPIIENVDMSKEKISDFLFTENDQTKKQFLFKIFNNKDLKGDLARIKLQEEMPEVTSKSGINIIFGTYDNLDYKLQVLNKVLEDVRATKKAAETIYLNKGPNPVLVLKR